MRYSNRKKTTTTLLLQYEDYVAHGVGAVQRSTRRSDLCKLNDEALYDYNLN